MPKGQVRLVAVLAALSVLFGSIGSAAAQQAQPGYDVLRAVQDDGVGYPYAVWVAWSPEIVTTPDGGAWAFFSVEPQDSAEAGTRGRLHAARFDPETAVWQPARPLPGGEIQFGATAVVDGDGQVHLVYSDRADAEPESFSSLLYTRSDGENGWTEPTAVAPHENAGHQLSPSLDIDGEGRLHLVWQDQRSVEDVDREASAANADVFVSDFIGDAWTDPVQINERPGPEVNASRPRIAAAGDRLIVLWSVYEVETGLESATRIEWSTRPAGDAEAAWSEQQVLAERGETQMGGRLLTMAADENGTVTLVYGRRAAEDNELFLRRLAADSNEWGDDISILNGDRGSYPTIAIGPDGTVYVVYNHGSGEAVHVGAIALAPGADQPGPEVVLTEGEAGAQGRAAVSVDGNGRVWVMYFHEPTGGAANEVRAIRGATVPTEPAADPEADDAEDEAEEDAEPDVTEEPEEPEEAEEDEETD